jgi:HrpA-like RNA helicase
MSSSGGAVTKAGKIGIMDPEGIHSNPLTDEPYSEGYREMARVWSKYPAYLKSKEILASIKKNPITFIISGTGSGKTAVVPRLALHFTNYQGKVGIVLPKQIITQSAAEFTAKMLDVPLGPDIGYIYRDSDRAYRKASKMIFVTDGTIINAYLRDPLLTDYKVIILDEAHERKIQIDIILLFLKTIIASGKRPDLRIIIMSATVDYEKYRDYFLPSKTNLIQIDGEPHYPITTRFMKNSIKDYVPVILNLIASINHNQPTEILTFITSGSEAKKLCQRITAENDKTFCIELYSGMDPERKAIAQSIDAYKDLGDYTQKVVMATNVAESSITIDGLECVIDGCHEVFSVYDSVHCADIFGKRWITKAQAIQRRGRVGRTAPGICYHLITQEQFDTLQDYPDPDVYTRDITQDLLRFIEISPGNTFHGAKEMLGQLMDPPYPINLESAERLFKMYNLITPEGQYTQRGVNIVKMATVTFDHAIFLLEAFRLKVISEAAIIVAALEKISSLSDLSILSPDCQGISKLIRPLINPMSDHLTLLNLFNAYDEQPKEHRKSWCLERCLQPRLMESIWRDITKIRRTAFQAILPPRIDRLSSAEDNQEGGSEDRHGMIIEALRRSHLHKRFDNGSSSYFEDRLKFAVSPNSTVAHFNPNNTSIIYDSLVGTVHLGKGVGGKRKWSIHTITILDNPK